MQRQKRQSPDDTSQRQKALSIWDDEGGAGRADIPVASQEQWTVRQPGNGDLIAIGVRIIGLKNVLMSFFATASPGVILAGASPGDYLVACRRMAIIITAS